MTGGAGYIGSHICVELLQAGYQVVVVDSLLNSVKVALERVERITGKSLKFYHHDLRDKEALCQVFETYQIAAVIHLAGLKAVGESCDKPLGYYQHNLESSMVLFNVMEQYGVKALVFSSSATVYGDPDEVPITEEAMIKPMNPYGQTKRMIEQIIEDVSQTGVLRAVLLRYFNPIGAHESGLIGEDPNGVPNNLLPYLAQVAVGKREQLSVFGDDYPTPDGTGIRDYIHVVDLAKGHLKALQKLLIDSPSEKLSCQVFNLGTGQGHSVLTMIDAFERVSGKTIHYQFVDRRPGDIAVCFANPTKAQQDLNWHAEKSLFTMINDTWRWQSSNPQGYQND